jgi:hypothetical protein
MRGGAVSDVSGKHLGRARNRSTPMQEVREITLISSGGCCRLWQLQHNHARPLVALLGTSLMTKSLAFIASEFGSDNAMLSFVNLLTV